jgi:hypothetical protein
MAASQEHGLNLVDESKANEWVPGKFYTLYVSFLVCSCLHFCFSLQQRMLVESIFATGIRDGPPTVELKDLPTLTVVADAIIDRVFYEAAEIANAYGRKNVTYEDMDVAASYSRSGPQLYLSMRNNMLVKK